MASMEDCDELETAADDSFYSQDRETVCNICNAEFLDPQDLQEHLTQIHKGLIYCKFCNSSVTDNFQYAIHVANEHLKSLKSCYYCTKIFLDYDQHRKHERRHYSAKKERFSCSQCVCTFEETSELERHEYEDHNNELDGFMMLDFFPVLSSVLNMKAVAFIQAMNTGCPCECRKCGFKSSNVDSYLQHLRRKKCLSYACDNCSTPYKSKRDMLRHLLRHNECFNFASKEKTRKCSECYENIPSRFYYNHTKHCKPIKCGLCNIVFITMEQLSDHQTKEHPVSVEVKFCKFCSRQCVGAYSLIRHMVRAHKHEIHLYKYKCIECDTPFKHPQKLFAHYFFKHKTLEPYTCKICDKKFRIRRRFTIHIKLDHKSIGFVEFDEKYRVFFDDKKSPKPFIPTCVLPLDELRMFMDPEGEMKKEESTATIKKEEKPDTKQETEKKGENKDIKKGKRKRNTTKPKEIPKVKAPEILDIISVDSTDIDDEDVPLVSLKKRKPKQEKTPFRAVWDRRKKTIKDNKKQLTCSICKKYCYTFQNFQHHMSLHRKNDVKVCIKCSKDFKSKKELHKHIETEHSSSKLTETLKSLLEKRKKSLAAENSELTQTERFQLTIKKSLPDTLTPAASLIQLSNGLSVQKYLETFTPEGDTVKPIANIIIEDSISIKKVQDVIQRQPFIKLTKFDPKPIDENPKLKYPVKFKPVPGEEINIKVKLVQNNCVNDLFDDDDFNTADRSESIPDVAQEVMLDGSEEPKTSHIPVQSLFKSHEDISIGHLQSKAPYYKIVKITEIPAEPDKTDQVISKDLIRLPDGTRLITVNPLAHLLGDKNVDDILQPQKKRYYKPKTSQDVENLLTKALEKAKTPTNLRKKRNEAKKRKQAADATVTSTTDESQDGNTAKLN